jgi:8-oxo-dGTP pyrophosphatase MutT (NUDIX family)
MGNSYCADLSLNHIRKQIQLTSTEGGTAELDHRIRAAVLMPLYRIDNCWNLLFTRRSDTVENHKGQVAFPGGALEKFDENLESAALREAEEEIGLSQDNVIILGRMKSIPTITRYQVTPIVGFIERWPFEFKIADHEVTRVFSIPLQWLSDDSNSEIRPYILPNGNKEEVILYKPYDGEILWGITARITQDFIKIINKK